MWFRSFSQVEKAGNDDKTTLKPLIRLEPRTYCAVRRVVCCHDTSDVKMPFGFVSNKSSCTFKSRGYLDCGIITRRADSSRRVTII